MSSRFVSHAGPNWRAVILVVTGMVLGVLVGQPTLAQVASGTVTPAATAKWASCPGMSFYPGDGTASYSSLGAERHGDGGLYCGLTLPHGATVTAVKFHLFDEATNEQIHHCSVIRVKLDPPDGIVQTLAGPLASGVSFASGYVVKSDLSIDHPVVDDRLYAYYAWCILSDPDAFAIVGVSVRYTPG